MRVLYHIPSLYSIYAHRTIYHGFRNAFLDMGHDFRPLTADQDMRDVVDSYNPHLFMTASFSWYRKYIDYKELKKRSDEGMFTLVKIDMWRSPLSKLRFNEAPSLKYDTFAVNLIKDGLMGDAYFHVLEQDDPRMDGFQEATGQEYHTIPFAADKLVMTQIRNVAGRRLPGKVLPLESR